MLQEIANFYSEDPIKFVYSVKKYKIINKVRSHVEAFPEVTELPAIVVYKPKRKRYIRFTKNVNNHQDVQDFIDELIGGSGTFQPMK